MEVRGSRRFEVRGWRSEFRGSKFEVRGSRFEVRSSRFENAIQRWKATFFECCELRFLDVDSAFERTCHIQTLLTSATQEPVKADSTLRTSRAVPHPSTDRALRRLTSEVRRDPVHSTRYGRQRSSKSFSSRFLFQKLEFDNAVQQNVQKTRHTTHTIHDTRCVFSFFQGHLDRARQNEQESEKMRPRNG